MPTMSVPGTCHKPSGTPNIMMGNRHSFPEKMHLACINIDCIVISSYEEISDMFSFI